MNIISQNYKNLLKNLMKDVINQKNSEFIEKLNQNQDILNYINIVDGIKNISYDVSKEIFEKIIIKLDQDFFDSFDRKETYDSDGFRTRKIVTSLGFVELKRRLYINKKTGKYFCYIDDFLGLPKREVYAPDVRALVLEEAANNNYMIKVGVTVGKIIDQSPFLSDSKNRTVISRQTVRNIILKSNKNTFIEESHELDTPDTIYVMADEKWVHNQRQDNSKTMIKSVVIYDGKKQVSKGRYTLLNKHTISNFTSNIWEDTLSYIDYTYDEDKLKNIVISGDGAWWIKQSIHELNFSNKIKLTYLADKFHIKEYLNLITKNDLIKNILFQYILDNRKISFLKVIDMLKSTNPSRENIITNKSNYIINNWHSARLSFSSPIGCCMESQISHTYASIFANRPKAYSNSSLQILLKLRTMFVNNNNIRRNFVLSLKKPDYLSFDDIPLSSPSPALPLDCKVSVLHDYIKKLSFNLK